MDKSMADKFEMKFDPRTIEHLGVKMYSTLPPALAELISNAYDADTSTVTVKFHERGSQPLSINISDKGDGMDSADIQKKFLVIGRNRRDSDGDTPTKRFNRLPTGKKGLGKLALFGLAKKITVDTVKNGKRNRFLLDWNELLNSDEIYSPTAELIDEPTTMDNGTTIKLSDLKRQTPFDVENIADTLSRIFIMDDTFVIKLEKPNGEKIIIDENRRYSQLNTEFEWDIDELISDESKYKGKLIGKFYTAETPIKPNSGLRGISLFSRGKLVNAPEYFSSSTSSHFFQYLTGWIRADFIDLITEDVISTNRQAINWDHPEMAELKEFLSKIINDLSNLWRKRRKEKKEEKLISQTGIDTERWLSSMPIDVRKHTEKIVEALGNEEAFSKFTPVIEALHYLIPEYPELHWRHLNDKLKSRIKNYYENNQYGEAADQGIKIFCEEIRKISGLTTDGTQLVGDAFGGKTPKIQVADISTTSGGNIQTGQEQLSRGLIQGFRNPINHAPIDSVVPAIFTELDCLNILSLISYLMTKVDKKVP